MDASFFFVGEQKNLDCSLNLEVEVFRVTMDFFFMLVVEKFYIGWYVVMLYFFRVALL